MTDLNSRIILNITKTKNSKFNNTKYTTIRFIDYIKYINNIKSFSKDNIKDIEVYIKYTLKQLNQSCYKAVMLRERRKEIRDDISDLESKYVKADNLEFNECGKNTGGKINNEELRHIKIKELKEKLEALTNQSLNLESSLLANKEMVRNIFDEYLNESQAAVMKLYYIENFSYTRIATEMFYCKESVRTVKNRAIKKLSSTFSTIILNNETL